MIFFPLMLTISHAWPILPGGRFGLQCFPFCSLVPDQWREFFESLTVRSNGNSTDDSHKWLTLRNSLLNELLLTNSVTYSNRQIWIKQRMIIEQHRKLYWGRSERLPSTDHLFPICVWSLSGFFTSGFLPSYLRLCEDVCMSLQGPASGNCALWYSTFRGRTKSVLLSVPSAQMFSIVACCLHLLDSRITQSSSYLLKPPCQSNVF